MATIPNYANPRKKSGVLMNLKNIPLQEVEVISGAGKNPEKSRGYMIKVKDSNDAEVVTYVDFDMMYTEAERIGIVKDVFKKEKDGYKLIHNLFGFDANSKLIMQKS
jgi:hypothetical protein